MSREGQGTPESKCATTLQEIEQFFQRYARAAEAMNANDLAGLHYAPCIKIHGDGAVECLPTHDAVREFFEVLAGKYATRDHSGGRFVELEVTPLGTAAALASLTWEHFRSDGSTYRRFRRSYNLCASRRTGKSWLPPRIESDTRTPRDLRLRLPVGLPLVMCLTFS